MTSTPTNEEVLTYLQQQAREHRDESDTCYDKATQAALLGNASSTINRLFRQADEHERLAELYSRAAGLLEGLWQEPEKPEVVSLCRSPKAGLGSEEGESYHFVVEGPENMRRNLTFQDFMPAKVEAAGGMPWPAELEQPITITGVRMSFDGGTFSSEVTGYLSGWVEVTLEVDTQLAAKLEGLMGCRSEVRLGAEDLPHIGAVELVHRRTAINPYTHRVDEQDHTTRLQGPFVARKDIQASVNVRNVVDPENRGGKVLECLADDLIRRVLNGKPLC